MKLTMVDNCCATARRLIAEGLDGAEVLEFYRGDVLCLRGRADAFAKSRVLENEHLGPVFVRWRDTLTAFKSSRNDVTYEAPAA